MGKGCSTGELDETKYSSPVPIIGLYIAAGSAVCMFFMLFDIISAFRLRNARWMPCRLFSLNSLTLTILSIISKIPVDLTTPMPGVYDQLAKLTGTTLICVSMGFFAPSLSEQSDSEFLTNMISLFLFVITVCVNICIQISTGVIYLFIKEHIIVMVCMCALLYLSWFFTKNLTYSKDVNLDINKDLMIKGKGSLLQRLKLCYLYGFNANPQLIASRYFGFQIILVCCLISFGALAQAAFRSTIMKQFKTCEANSDYEWSMWMIVLFQILTILTGCFALSFRWFNFDPGSPKLMLRDKDADAIILDNRILGVSSGEILRRSIDVMLLPITTLVIFAWFPIYILKFLSCCFCHYWHIRRDKKLVLSEYQDLVKSDDHSELNRWTVYKASNDMKRWMEVSKSKGAAHLSRLLSGTNPSPDLCTKRCLDDLYPDDEIGFEVSSLSMALLVKIASISLPSSFSKSLEYSFEEAYEIIDFVETKIKSTTFKAKIKTKLTKALLRGDGFTVLLPKIRMKHAEFHSQPELNQACIILRELKSIMPPDLISEEVEAITNVINRQGHQTLQDLYDHIRQMFVDMLHLFLIQFPNAIYKEVADSSAKEFEEKIANILKMLWKIEPLEDQVTWLFPGVCDISSLITPKVPVPLPGESQGVGIDGSSPTDGVELQVCASVSDPTDDPLGIPNDAPSNLEDAATRLSEIVVIPTL